MANPNDPLNYTGDNPSGPSATKTVPQPGPAPSVRATFVTPPIRNLGDLLDLQRAALQEAIFRKGTSDDNRSELRQKLASLPTVAELGAAALFPPGEFLISGAKHYQQMPHVLQGLYDDILDQFSDPLTYETLDVGMLGKAAVKILGPIAKAASKIAPLAKAGKFVSDEALKPLVNTVTRVFNFGGDAIVSHGRSQANTAIGILNRSRAEDVELSRRLTEMDDKIMHGLTPKQTSAVQKILHGQLPDALVQEVYAADPAVKKAVGERRELFDAVIRMQEAPGSGLTSIMEKERGGPLDPIPEALQHFAGRPGEFGIENFRPQYFPARGQAAAVAADQPERTFNLLDTYNPHIREQNEFHITSKDVGHFEDAAKGMLRTSARNIAANRAKDEIAKIYGGLLDVPENIRKILDVTIPAKGAARSDTQRLAALFKGFVNLPKLGIVGTTPIHMFNILSLLLAHAPEEVPGAIANFTRILKAGKGERARFEAMLPAIEHGIDVSTHEKGGNILSHLPLNRATWDWDAAAKLALTQKYLRQGYKPLDAGIRATNDLVNYRNASPATAALRFFMPFATFAEGGAKSVGAAVLKHPAQVEFVNRVTGGRFLGGGDPKTDATLYWPTADVGRGPGTYLRSKTSDLIKLPLALSARAVLPGYGGVSAERWILSGRTPGQTLLDIGTGPIPYARDLLNMIPVHGGKTLRGYQADTPLNAGVFSSTGVSLPKPKATPPPMLAPVAPKGRKADDPLGFVP